MVPEVRPFENFRNHLPGPGMISHRSVRSLPLAHFPLWVALAYCSNKSGPPPSHASPDRTEGLSCVDFQRDEVGKGPQGFTSALTGGGPPPTWVVQADSGQPNGRVLAQTSADDTDYRFPLCVFDGFSARDVSVSTRFQAREGEIDRAGGLVVRYRDANNYYITRANALEDNVRLYRVVNGERQQFAGEKKTVAAGVWHALRLDVSGPRFAVFFDGELLFTATDDAFADAGKVGLWTKADSVTWFDDLRYGPVVPDSPVLASTWAGR